MAERVFIADRNAPQTEGNPGMTVQSVLDDADADSTFPTEVAGLPATGFERSTAEPIYSPWPAVVWERDSLVIRVLGEGLERADIDAAAGSLEAVTRDEFDELVPQEHC